MSFDLFADWGTAQDRPADQPPGVAANDSIFDDQSILSDLNAKKPVLSADELAAANVDTPGREIIPCDGGGQKGCFRLSDLVEVDDVPEENKREIATLRIYDEEQEKFLPSPHEESNQAVSERLTEVLELLRQTPIGEMLIESAAKNDLIFRSFEGEASENSYAVYSINGNTIDFSDSEILNSSIFVLAEHMAHELFHAYKASQPDLQIDKGELDFVDKVMMEYVEENTAKVLGIMVAVQLHEQSGIPMDLDGLSELDRGLIDVYQKSYNAGVENMMSSEDAHAKAMQEMSNLLLNSNSSELKGRRNHYFEQALNSLDPIERLKTMEGIAKGDIGNGELGNDFLEKATTLPSGQSVLPEGTTVEDFRKTILDDSKVYQEFIEFKRENPDLSQDAANDDLNVGAPPAVSGGMAP